MENEKKKQKLKTYVLTVSRYFPATHKRKGEPTYFPEKILNSQGKLVPEWANLEMNILINEVKIHTIRSNKNGTAFERWSKKIKEVQEGKAILSIRYWNGKPYNSKQVEICQLNSNSGIGVQKIRFPFPNLHCFKIDEIEHQDMALSKNDGLSYEDFKEWFRKYDLSKPMAIIHLTSFRY